MRSAAKQAAAARADNEKTGACMNKRQDSVPCHSTWFFIPLQRDVANSRRSQSSYRESRVVPPGR